jgi:hypothetical protein
MRYYAGNWATSLWLFRPRGLEKLEGAVRAPFPPAREQLQKLYGEGAFEAVVGRVHAFRSMHLHGRALNSLVSTAVVDLDDPDVRARGIDAFVVIDGELVAGMVLGWNFGEGHLHNEQLLAALQEQVGFEAGEVRCVFLEGQAAGRSTMWWRIADAATGRIAEGNVPVDALLQAQPWSGDVDVAGART